MAGLFEDKRITWDGKVYVIPARRVLEGIALIEEHLTLPELLSYGARQTVPMAKIAKAYGALLRHAGADLTDDDVYIGIFGAIVGADQHASAVVTTCAGLIQMMVPKSKGAPVLAPGETAPTAGNSQATENMDSLSGSGSRSPSHKAGARRSSSGSSRRQKST